MVHELKTHPQFFSMIVAGTKTLIKDMAIHDIWRNYGSFKTTKNPLRQGPLQGNTGDGPTSSPALMSKDADPQVGSQIREPGFDLVSFAMSVETSFGVKNSPAFLPASLAKFSIRNM